MSFKTRILAALLVVGVLPAATVSLFSYGANRDELVRTAADAQTAIAIEAARHTGQLLSSTVDGLRLAVDYIPVQSLAREDLQDVLALPFRQLRGLDALAVLDPRGAAVVPPLVREDSQRTRLASFASSIPFEEAAKAGVALGRPHIHADDASRSPRLAVAVRVNAVAQPASGNAASVLAAELSLEQITSDLSQLATGGRTLALWADGTGPFWTVGGEHAFGAAEESLVSAARDAGGAIVRQLTAPDGSVWLVSAAAVPDSEWVLSLAQPEAAALGPARRMARYTWFWAIAALGLAAVLGFALASGIGAPIEALSHSAQALASGDYRHRTQLARQDELGRLATTFNAMATEIQRRDQEIRAWNETLQRRVEEKTEQLRVARDQVERSRRLTAMASLGAGMTHELNNPLTSIIGLTTIVRQDVGDTSPHAPLLDQALQDARRIATIVDRFRELTDGETRATHSLDLAQIFDSVTQEPASGLSEGRVEVVREFDPAASTVRGRPEELRVVVSELVKNAVQAMPQGGRLHVSTSAPEEGLVRLTLSDSGHGIPPEIRERIFDPFFTTKPEGSGTGMGLSVSHRIVEAHHGRIVVDSTPGRGTTIHVFLPAPAARAHLT